MPWAKSAERLRSTEQALPMDSNTASLLYQWQNFLDETPLALHGPFKGPRLKVEPQVAHP